MPHFTPWTPHLESELRRLWRGGMSASRIGAALGVTKNAIVGKRRRMKLPGRLAVVVSGRGERQSWIARASVEERKLYWKCVRAGVSPAEARRQVTELGMDCGQGGG